MRESAKGLCLKVWTQTKILSPNIRYFVAILRFVAIYARCGRLWAKQFFLGQKQSFLGKWYIWYILRIINRCICRENSKYVSDEVFFGHFGARQKAANFCHPESRIIHNDSILCFKFSLRNPKCSKKVNARTPEGWTALVAAADKV